jgi:hypothetical protein
MMERNHLKDLGVDRRIILKWTFETWDEEACNGLLWHSIGTGGGHL